MKREYDKSNISSIFNYSEKLLNHSLAEVISEIDPNVGLDELEQSGKGGLGVLVEKYFFGYEPNSSPLPDFAEAGLELKVSPLKKNKNGDTTIKERLVCDMIDYMTIADEKFEDSRFFKKSALMLIILYLHISEVSRKDLKFIYSILWQIKDKDLLIIKQDFLKIQEKVRKGLAHELSEGDTMYLGACRKGSKNQPLRKQPNNTTLANARAFSLKVSYMNTILDFAKRSGSNKVSNLNLRETNKELVSIDELKQNSFDNILLNRIKPYIGKDYRQIASMFESELSAKDKSRYANAIRLILTNNKLDIDSAEEIKKSGIKVKTIRIQKSGRIKEHISFENIDYKEIYECDDWIESKWYEIITNRYMFVVFREVEDKEWSDEARFVLDKMFFWTMPSDDMAIAKEYWRNIKYNVSNNTLTNSNNTFWTIKDHKYFHVRPKARDASDTTISPINGTQVPKKCYWFNNEYLMKEVKKAYGDEWNTVFKTKEEK